MSRIQTEWVAMSDGVKLFTVIYLPESSAESFPVLLFRHPYCSPRQLPREPERLAGVDGLAVVVQHCRGTGASEGVWYPWWPELADGRDCLAWLRRCPWCNGRVVMAGASYLGAAQYFAAASGDPVLVGIAPDVAPCDYHESPKYVGGAFVLRQNISWALDNFRHWRRPDREAPLPPLSFAELDGRLPLAAIDQATCGEEVGFWQDWLRHPACDDYWAPYDLATLAGNIQVPALISSGWFDIYTQGALDAFSLLRRGAGSAAARRFTRCLIGPWSHGGEVGELDCGPDCSRERHYTPLRDRFLRGLLADPEADPVPGEPPLRYFMLGANDWRSAECWPPPEAVPTPWYLGSSGAANTRFGDGTLGRTPAGPADTLISDPRQPVPTTGGHFIGLVNCSHDQSEVEERSDVLVYTSPALERDLEIAGRVTLVLYGSCSAPDCDWTAKLVDVFPDGRAFNLADGILRARYRCSRARAELLEPGRIYEFRIDLWSIANRFRRGHRVRLEIAASNFPAYARNAQTGNDPATDVELRVAALSVRHDAEYPSHLMLPELRGV